MTMLGGTRIALVWGTIALSATMACGQQTTPGKTQKSETKPSAPSRNENKPSLADVTRVSTERVASSAARDKSRKDTEQGAVSESAEPAVLEFQPASPSARTASDSTKAVKDSGKSASKKAHGEVYGSLDPKNAGDRASGASVGATSRTGKTSVYVETNQSRAKPPAPH